MPACSTRATRVAALPALRRGAHVLVTADGRVYDYRITGTLRVSFRDHDSRMSQWAPVAGRPREPSHRRVDHPVDLCDARGPRGGRPLVRPPSATPSTGSTRSAGWWTCARNADRRAGCPPLRHPGRGSMITP